MNMFTHGHNYEVSGFYMCIVMCQKVVRSADQSLQLNTFCWQEAVSALVCKIKVWQKNILSMTWNAVQYAGMSGGALLHNVEDEKLFAVSVRHGQLHTAGYTGP